MRVDIGTFAATVRDNNVFSTRRAVHLYGLHECDAECVRKLSWGNSAAGSPSIDSIEPGAFASLSDLTAITVDEISEKYKAEALFSESDMLWKPSSFGWTLICCPPKYFSDDSHQTIPNIPDYGSIEVWDYAFYGMQFSRDVPEYNNGLSQFIFSPDGLQRVSKIGDCSFAESNIRELVLWSNLHSIGIYAFMNCKQLQTVSVEKEDVIFEVSKIPTGMFYGCESLTEVHIPEGVVYIGSNAFANCYNLRKVFIPSSLNCICENAFKGCNNVEIVVPNNSQLRHLGISEYTYLAGEPDLEICNSSQTDIQLEYFRNNYAIHRGTDVDAVGNVCFSRLNDSVKMPSVIGE